MSCCGGNCADCPGGGCSGCAGKGGAITLHPAEIDILRELAACPFLPVGLNSRTGEPFCPEFPDMDEKIVPLALSEKARLYPRRLRYSARRLLPMRAMKSVFEGEVLPLPPRDRM